MASGQKPQLEQAAAVLVPDEAAAGTDEGSDRGPARLRWLPHWTQLLTGAVALAIMLWGITGPSYWKDETATLSADERTLPQLFHMFHRVDVVHGFYYLLLWPVVHFVGVSKWDTRLPSAVAMTLAAVGVAAIGGRIRSRRAGLYAGLVFALLPMASERAHDARPYAAETFLAVLASYLLIRAAQDPRRRWWFAYGGSLVLLGYMHMFGLLIIAAHMVALFPLARMTPVTSGGWPDGSRTATPDELAARPVAGLRLLLRWMTCGVAALLIEIPLIYFGWQQRVLIDWLPAPSWHQIELLARAYAGTGLALLVLAILIVTGLGRADWQAKFPLLRPRGQAALLARAKNPLHAWAGRREAALTALAVPWLVLPPAILLITSMVSHVYDVMYVSYCLPAVALLAGAGLAALGHPLRLALVAVLAVAVLPVQQFERTGPAGGGIQAANRFLMKFERPGDDVWYPGMGGVPTWSEAYPNGFGQLDAFAEYATPAQAGRLVGIQNLPPKAQLKLPGVQRLWIAEQTHWRPIDLNLSDFREVRHYYVNHMWLQLYVRVSNAPVR